MKKELTVLGVIVGLVIIGAVGWRWLVTGGTITIPGATITEYQDRKFTYRFVYPNTWTTKRLALFPGYIEVLPPAKKPYSLAFWYRDSPVVKSVADLEAFVKNDAAYAKSHDGTNTIKIFPQQLGTLDGLAWDYQDKDGRVSRAYYVADFTPSADQNIFVWTAFLLNQSNSLDDALADQDVQSILASHRLTLK